MSKIQVNNLGIKLSKTTKVAIVFATYNSDITNELLISALDTLGGAGVDGKNISVVDVPGAYELPYACQQLAQMNKYNAIISLGCVIKGQTPHFDYIALNASRGIMNVSLKFDIPIVFGVLTTNTLAQAKARIRGGNRGDKGAESAQTAIQLIHTFNQKNKCKN